MHVLLQYQSKSYYIIGQEVYYSIGRFITLSGSYYIIGRFLLHYRAVITVSGVYYIIGWYNSLSDKPCTYGRPMEGGLVLPLLVDVGLVFAFCFGITSAHSGYSFMRRALCTCLSSHS